MYQCGKCRPKQASRKQHCECKVLRLFLNYSLQGRELWLQDVPGIIALRNANWPKLKE